MTALTIIAFMILLHHHVVYPVLLKILAGRNLTHNPTRTMLDAPSFTLIIPAYNEQRWIADKIVNLACLDYPEDRLSFVIACDGCTDGTAEIARRTADSLGLTQRVAIHDHKVNRGKLALLNDEIARCQSDIVALSDVSALLSIDAIQIAAAHFGEQRTGVVAGRYMLANAGTQGEADYWQFQSRLREKEAMIGGAIGASGAFFAFRREHFTALPADTINDDFVLPMMIVERGHDAVFESDIHAVELEGSDLAADWKRRQRIGAGNFQQSVRLWRLLDPNRPGLAFVFFSGKWLRPVQPFAMLLALFGSTALAADSMIFAGALACQLLAYALATCVECFPEVRWPGALRKVHYLILGHVACLVGIVRYLMGRPGLVPGNSHISKEA